MSHTPTDEIQRIAPTHVEQLVRPESPTAELLANVPLGENNERENNLFLYPDSAYNVRDFILQEDNIGFPDKSYEDGSPNEICAFKLDQEKIDEFANDYCVETCISSSRESVIQNEPYEGTVRSDGTSSRNKDESQCKSNRERKIQRKMPEDIILDLSNDVYGTSHGDIKISVISIHNLLPEVKILAKRHSRFSMWNRDARKKRMSKMIDSPVLAIFYDKNYRNTEKSAKRKRKNSQKKLVDNTLHTGINTTVDVSNQLENALSEQRELHLENNLQSFHIIDEIFDSRCCLHDAFHDVQHSVLNAKQTCVGDMRKHDANCCCAIFDDTHQDYHICNQKNYNVDSDFNADMQPDWMAECFHSEHRHAEGCRCSCISSECYPDINMQHDCCPSIRMRTVRPFKNSALPKKHQRKEIKRFESIALEFATEADEYSPDRDERGNWCANCVEERKGMANTIRKCAASNTSGSIADLRDSSIADASRYEIDTRLEERGRQTATITTATMMGREGEQPNKSDLLKAVDTRDTYATRDRIERRCSGRVVAVPSRADRSPGEKGRFVRGVDSEWKPGSIETDARQLDYKWKRRIATVDAGMHASVNFKGKCDSRYKSEETIRVQLRESVEIRKRESLQMVEATSQTRSDDTNADGKRREMRYYSLWTSLQTGKIWSQVHDACKNVVKLAATSVGRIVKDALERSPRNPIEVADAKAFVESSSSCADKICGETCRKNLICLKSGTRLETHERAIEDAGECRKDTEISMRENLRAITLPRRDMRKHARQNAEKEEDEKSCVFYNEIIALPEHERDKYRNIGKFSPQNKTYDGNVYLQSRLSGSFSYLENSAYSGLRNRGGSDDNRDFARSTEDKQKSTQHAYDIKETRSVHHRDLIPMKCSCSKNQIIHVRCVENRNSQHVIVSHETCAATDCRIIHADVSRNNPLDHEDQLTSVSFPEDNKQRETHATPPTGSHKEMEVCKNIEHDTETKRNLTSEIANAMVSSMNLAVYSSRNDPDEPIASTSKWETTPVPSEGLRGNRSTSRTPICAAMKFWRKRSAVANKKIIAPVFKRRKSIGRGKLSVLVATTHDSKMKTTQIEPSTVQTAREGNKRRTYVNVQMQTPDAIVGRILSEFFVSGERKKTVLMSITLQSDSNHDVSDRKEISSKEAETQTTLNDVSSVAIDTFDYSCEHFPAAVVATTKTIPCFVCDKRDCYEIKRSDDSITLEDALIAEYPETSELDDYIAKRKTKISP